MSIDEINFLVVAKREWCVRHHFYLRHDDNMTSCPGKMKCQKSYRDVVSLKIGTVWSQRGWTAANEGNSVVDSRNMKYPEEMRVGRKREREREKERERERFRIFQLVLFRKIGDGENYPFSGFTLKTAGQYHKCPSKWLHFLLQYLLLLLQPYRHRHNFHFVSISLMSLSSFSSMLLLPTSRSFFCVSLPKNCFLFTVICLLTS